MDQLSQRYLMEILDRVSRTEALMEGIKEDLAAHSRACKITQNEVVELKIQIEQLDADQRGFITIFKVGSGLLAAIASIVAILRFFH